MNVGSYEVLLNAKYKVNEKVDREAAEITDLRKRDGIWTPILPLRDL